MLLLMIWLVIVIASLLIEIITVDLVSIWFGIGGIAALICYLLNLSIPIQIAAFVIISIIMMIIIRPIAKRYLRTNIVSTNYDRVIGKHALVTRNITSDSKGEVKVLSTFWSATSIDNNDITEGEYCEVLAVEGAHLIVRKI